MKIVLHILLILLHVQMNVAIASTITGGIVSLTANTGDINVVGSDNHATWSAVVANLSGGSALAGAIAQWLYDKPVDQLTEEERQNVVAYTTVVGGLAGLGAGGAGSSTLANIAQGATAARNEVENNYLGTGFNLFGHQFGENQVNQFAQDMDAACKTDPTSCQATYDKWRDTSYAQGGLTTEADKQGWEEFVVGMYQSQVYPRCNGNPDCENIVSANLAQAMVIFAGDVQGLRGNISGLEYAVNAAEGNYGRLGLQVLGDTAPIIGVLGVGAVAANRAALIEEALANGVKVTPGNVIAIGRNSNGQVVFLETGKVGEKGSGFAHIIEEHKADFANIGVTESQIPSVIMQAVRGGKVVGYQGKGTGRPIYEVVVNGRPQRIAITVSDNGYIVGANPRGAVK